MVREKIVVGIDGSDASRFALEWAIREARIRDADVEVIHAWQYPAVGMVPYGGAMMPSVATDDLEKDAERLARRVVDDVMGDRLTPSVTITVTMGHPGNVLVNASEGADLLVVGSRGRGGFSGLLLGSVSTNVVHHAECPVVVIRRRRG